MLKEREKAAEPRAAPGVRRAVGQGRPHRRLSRTGRSISTSGAAKSSAWPASSAPAAPNWRACSSASTRASAARCELDGKPACRSVRPRTRSRSGIFLVPEDRKLTGILLDLSIAQNISLPNLPAHAARWLVVRRRRSCHRREAAKQSRHQGAHGGDAHRHAVGRQPAEGRAGQVAGHEAQGDDLRRADARHRRRRQGRNLRADARRWPMPASPC